MIEKEQKQQGLKRKLFHYFQYLYIYKIGTFMVKKGTKTLNEDNRVKKPRELTSSATVM